MSNTIEFKPGVVFDLSPSEGDDRNGNWISPFSIPKGVHIWTDERGQIRAVEFEYSGGESGESRELLDGDQEPPIQLFLGHKTKKILQMNFGLPVTEGDFPRIAERLESKAKQVKYMGVRFNFLMISKIFSHWENVAEMEG